jgi:CheY-like chemotaxis protein
VPDDDLTSVLIVDDDPHHQRLLQAHLEGHGCRIQFASDGVEAMERLMRKPLDFDVVLLDRVMPRMDGMEVLARIKSDRTLKRLPVIMQTGSSTSEEILAGIRAGAYYYLTKPYDVETMVTMVTTAARDFGEYRRLRQEMKRGLECLTLVSNATLIFRTVSQAKATAAVVSNTCPDPSSAVIGLTELLVNAVEHGNLGITYEEKTLLNANGRW